MANKRPWYPWFPADFKASPRVQTLTLEQEACFRRLLDIQWLSADCTIPDNMQMHCMWTANAMQEQCNRDAVLQFFPVVAPGVRANQRLTELYLQACDKSETRKNAANTRWGKENKGEKTPDANAYHLQCDPDPDPDPKKYNATVPAATDIPAAPKNVLKEYRILSKAYQTFWADIQKRHPAVKYPDKTTPAGLKRHKNTALVLSQLVRLDGFSETRIMEIWRWLFDSEDQQAVFWSQQTQSLELLRKKKTGDTLNRFQKIAGDYDRAEKKPKPLEEDYSKWIQ